MKFVLCMSERERALYGIEASRQAPIASKSAKKGFIPLWLRHSSDQNKRGRAVDAQLQVGAQTERIEVTAEAARAPDRIARTCTLKWRVTLSKISRSLTGPGKVCWYWFRARTPPNGQLSRRDQ